MLREENTFENNEEQLLPENSVGYLEQLGKKILANVKQTCCLGAWNKSGHLEAAKQFDFLLKAVTVVFLGTLRSEVKKQLDDFLQQRKNRALKNRFYQLKEKAEAEGGVIITCVKNSVGNYFKCNDKQLQLPPEFYANADLLKILQACFPLSTYNKWAWTKEMVDNLKPYLATYLSEYLFNHSRKSYSQSEASLKFLSVLTDKKFLQEKQLIEQFEAGEEFASDKQQELFFQQTLNDVKNNAILFGTGNCALMADCAFLTALSLDPPFQITYIRFVSKDPKMEVINAVAIGNWPDIGCFIIVPWQQTGLSYPWQGSIKTTPEIPTVYDEVKVLVRLGPDSENRAKFRAMLAKQGYGSWLSIPQRFENLARVDSIAAQFFNALQKADIISEVTEEAKCKMGL